MNDVQTMYVFHCFKYWFREGQSRQDQTIIQTQLRGIMDEMVKNRPEIARQSTQKASQFSASSNQPSTSSKHPNQVHDYSIDQ